MKQLIIEVWGKCKFKPIISINGHRVDYQTLDGKQVIYYNTSESAVTVTITRILEINSKWWFPLFLLYAIISIFGIFDIRGDHKYLSYKCSFEVDLINSKTDISVNLFKVKRKGQPVAEITGKTNIRIIENVCEVDKKAKRRTIILRLTKLLLLAAGVAILICALSGIF